jgi:hypothetical protein
MENNDPTSSPVTSSQISTWGKVLAGVLLTLFILLALNVIISYWPDKLPPAGDAGLYYHKCHVTFLVDKKLVSPPYSTLPDTAVTKSKGKAIDTAVLHKALKATNKTIDSVNAAIKTNTDTNQKKVLSVKLLKTQKNKAALMKADTAKVIGDVANKDVVKYSADDVIQFNTILLILVAAAGFLGNMVHIATSFTAFVGLGKFNRNWILWYAVKPFTASALALIVYFTFRAGFLSSNDGGSNLNLYGIMSISAMAGLFTEVVTRKLRDVLDVAFKLNGGTVTVPVITGATPPQLTALMDNIITIAGTNLDKVPLTITMDGKAIPAAGVKITPTSLAFHFTAGAAGTSPVLSVTGTGVKTYTQTFTIAR